MSLKIFKSKSALVRMTFCATFAIGLSVFTSCETNSLSELTVVDSDSDSDIEIEGPVSITYDNTARSVLDNACVECHNVNESAGGERLDNFENAAAVAASGRMIARMTDVNNPMPPAGNLPNVLIEDIMQWIEDGILENEN